MKFKFLPIDYDYFEFEGKNYVKIIGRIENGKRVCLIDSCDVYFWAILKKDVSSKKAKDIAEKIERIKINKENRVSNVLKTELHKKKFLGKDVKAIKVLITNYKDAHDIADKIELKEIEKKRECDLSFITRYILEKKLKPLIWHDIEGELLNGSDFGGIANLEVDFCIKIEKIKESEAQTNFKPRVLAYDIETDEFEIGKGQILMVSLVGENFKKVLTWKKSNKNYVESFRDEEEMLEKFVKYVKEYEPDILVGYFSDGFDLPYLRARAEKKNVKLSLGLDGSHPTFSRGRLLIGKIKGIVHIDLLRFIKTTYSQYLQSETLSLNEVASELLGEKKTNWNHKHSSKINGKEWEDYFEYNLQDTILTYKLTEKLWQDLVEFTKIIQEPLLDISRDSMSTQVENYIIHNIEKFNEIIEKKPYQDEIGNRKSKGKYEGAFVFQPTPGLYEELVFFDFTSMYASVIVSYNLSKSTFLEKKEKRILKKLENQNSLRRTLPKFPQRTSSLIHSTPRELKSSEIAVMQSSQKEALEIELGKEKVYFSKEIGFFSEMLKEIIDKRKKYKKEYNENPNSILKARSNAFKLLANAAYGYQGFFGARYYCFQAAASTAALARKLIKETIDYIKKEGYEVIYGDTDSITILKKEKSKKEVLELLRKINERLPGIMELDLEGFFKRGIWVTKRTGDIGAKKKYALIDENDKIKIRGFETVRRDWCNLARETQNKVLELILKDGNEKKAIEYIKEVIKKIKNREVKLDKLIIKTQLKKSIEEYKNVSPHVTIAKKMKEQGLPVNVGMLIEYYISELQMDKKKVLIRERAKMPEEKGKYDIDYYLNNQILPAIENIFEVFDVNVNELFDGKKQMSLGDF